MLTQESSNEDLLYERVADHIVKLIDKGTLQAGERLPSIRKLSSQMDVSISTVLQAYMVLEGKDWIEAKPQSGFYVRPGRNLPPEPKASTPSPVVTRVGVSELVAQVFQSAHDPQVIQLALSTPSPDHLPVKRLNRLMAAATARWGRAIFHLGIDRLDMRLPNDRSMQGAGLRKMSSSRLMARWKR